MKKITLTLFLFLVYFTQAQTNTIVVHPNNRVASLQMSSSDYQSWITNDDFGDNDKRYALTQELYQEFEDEFDFIFLVLNEEDVPANIGYYGKLIGVSNSIQNLGMNQYDFGSNYGSNGKLQAIMQLSLKTGVQNGPALHELMHNWANFLIPTEVGGHWGYAGGNNKGQLGGFDQSTLVENGGNSYSVGNFGGNANGGNSVPYTNLELYFMGLIPSSEVEEFDVFTDISNVSYTQSTTTFTAQNRQTFSGASIVADNGERIPNHVNSQKEFRLLTVVLTDTELTDAEWESFDSQVERFGRNSDNGISGNYNFWEATGGRATLDVENISPNVTPVTQITLEDIETTLVDVSEGILANGDVDGDGDQDVFLSGILADDSKVSKIYLNDGNGNFTESTQNNITPVYTGDADFGDFDQDGDLDLLISGHGLGNLVTTEVYVNDGNGVFTEYESDTDFTEVYKGSAEFVDIDGDNKLDIALSGKFNFYSNTNFTGLYIQDDSGNFVALDNTNLPNVGDGELAFYDIDQDGDKDVFIVGQTDQIVDQKTVKVTKLYLNDGSENFTESNSWTPLIGANISIGDIDGDNDQDVLFFGTNSETYYNQTIVLKNDGSGNLTEDQELHIIDIGRGDSDLADFDNDGDLDLIVSGYASSGGYFNLNTTKLYANIDGKFYHASSSQLQEVNNGKLIVLDIDGNTTQDLIVVGSTYINSETTPYTNVYKNALNVEIPEYNLDPIITECSYNYTTPPTITTLAGETITGTTTDDTNFTSIGEYTINWNFEENTGNIIEIAQQIFVQDITKPVTPTLGPITTICSYTFENFPTTTDNCAGEITATTVNPTTYSEVGEYTITWKFEDGNGNSINVNQTVTIEDNEDPIVPTLEPIVTDCAYTFEAPIATDNCAGEVTATTENQLSYDIQGSYTITWKFDDGNGNVVNINQSLTIEDNIDPVTPTLEKITAACGYTFENFPTTTDNCAGEITATTDTPTSYDTVGEYTVLWKFNDGNGNIILVPQLLEITNSTGEMAAPALETIEAECSFAFENAPTIEDACFGTITGTTTNPTEYNEIGSFDVVWTFEGEDGNSVQSTQTVIIQDTTAPEAITLNPIIANCEITVTDIPSTPDNCSILVNGTTSDSLEFTEPGEYTITWIFNDGNGNSTKAVQEVIVNGEELVAPTLATVTENCSYTVTEIPTINNLCAGTIVATTTSPVSYSEEGEYTIVWNFNDGNGNSVQANQTIIILGNELVAPVLDTINTDCSYTFEENPTTMSCFGTVTGTTSNPTEYILAGSYEVVWTFTDEAGNSVQSTQTVNIEDNEAPITPTLLTIGTDCSYSAETPPTTTDNCSGTISGTTSDDTEFIGTGEYTITWTFTDASGNSTQATQTIVIEDTDAPVIPTLETAYVSCGVSIDVPVAQDNCSGEINGSTTSNLNIFESGVHDIIWTFEDESGNISTTTQTIIVSDTEAPIAPTIPDTYAQCEYTVTNVPYAPDLCGGVVTTTHDQESLTFNEPGIYVITWSFEDSSENISTTTQTIIIEDTEAPIIQNCFNGTEINLGTACEYTLLDYTTDIQVTDNCSTTITATQIPAAGTIITENTDVVITYDDGNGNTSECTFKIEIMDDVAPLIICPETQDKLAENGIHTLEDISSLVQILDACDDVTFTQSPEIGTELEVGLHTITVNIEDGFGNTNSCQFIMNVVTELSITDYDKNNFGLYPNPANDVVLFKTNQIISNVIIYDVTGKIVFKQNGDQIKSLDLSELSSGMYSVLASTKNGKNFREKLIIK
ncbi:T9SS type A sorting domain-containing protein [Aureivirga sp. CE67]|uniref:T9SS type A sorting domain-containing protein n=1 Tax=Aureivirga sp. CE67 TaxID=1788983 RepID=UPI0018C9BB42|nr:T9SS type A sorting domain-containing protein [Aureivirga sp. CE67]